MDINSEPCLFEISWEVANKVGGIYTVIKTKAAVTVDEYGENYYLIGPYSYGKASMEVEEREPKSPAVCSAINRMRQQGIRVVTGKWLVEGSPSVLLFDLASVSHRLDEWKADLWEKSAIPSPPNDREMNDSILLGYAVAWFLGEFSYLEPNLPIIAQFHEWMSAVGGILIKKRNLRIATIFTTHATLLGRYLCAGNVDFYNRIKTFNEDEEAGKRGIYHRYCLERAATHCADVFTTVSHITAYEAEHLLKRKPDGVLPNGLNSQRFSTLHELHNKHNENKEKIHAFVQGHFYGHNDFEVDNTLYFFTAGRYEFRNKGVDLYLEALARKSNMLVDL
jgi:glycogen(starch) synthase